jgi:AAA+ superfamily predicted ATPase
MKTRKNVSVPTSKWGFLALADTPSVERQHSWLEKVAKARDSFEAKQVEKASSPNRAPQAAQELEAQFRRIFELEGISLGSDLWETRSAAQEPKNISFPLTKLDTPERKSLAATPDPSVAKSTGRSIEDLFPSDAELSKLSDRVFFSMENIISNWKLAKTLVDSPEEKGINEKNAYEKNVSAMLAQHARLMELGVLNLVHSDNPLSSWVEAIAEKISRRDENSIRFFEALFGDHARKLSNPVGDTLEMEPGPLQHRPLRSESAYMLAMRFAGSPEATWAEFAQRLTEAVGSGIALDTKNEDLPIVYSLLNVARGIELLASDKSPAMVRSLLSGLSSADFEKIKTAASTAGVGTVSAAFNRLVGALRFADEQEAAHSSVQKEALAEGLKNVYEMMGAEELKRMVVALYFESKQTSKPADSSGKGAAATPAPRMVLLGSAGTGKSSAAEYLAKVMYGLGHAKSPELIKYSPTDFIGKYVGHTGDKTRNALEKGKDKTILIDEFQGIWKALDESDRSYGPEALNELKDWTIKNPGTPIILAGHQEVTNLLGMVEGLKSRFPLEAQFLDLSDSQLTELANKYISEQGLKSAAVDVSEFVSRLSKERNYPGWANTRTLQGRLGEAVGRLHVRVGMAKPPLPPEETKVLKSEDFLGDNRTALEAAEAASAQLKDYIGIDEALHYAESLEKLHQVQVARAKNGMPAVTASPHAAFLGPPGVGKTTTARLIAQRLAGSGVLTKGHFIEASRKDLVQPGRSAAITEALVNNATGGVLFLNEAYSIVKGPYDGEGLIALDALNKLLDNRRDNLIVIMDGYNEQIEELFSYNPGFKSRFNNLVQFKPVDADMIVGVALKFLSENHYTIDDDALALLASQVDASRGKEGFANGRTVRDALQQVYLAQAFRLSDEADVPLQDLPAQTLSHLTKRDVEAAFGHWESSP